MRYQVIVQNRTQTDDIRMNHNVVMIQKTKGKKSVKNNHIPVVTSLFLPSSYRDR